MSEKRFIFVDNIFKYLETGIKDNKSDYDSLNGESVVDLLNYQDRLIEEQHDEIINWTKKYVGIKKENEQLRKDKEQLKERLRECGMRLDRFNCR